MAYCKWCQKLNQSFFIFSVWYFSMPKSFIYQQQVEYKSQKLIKSKIARKFSSVTKNVCSWFVNLKIVIFWLLSVAGQQTYSFIQILANRLFVFLSNSFPSRLRKIFHCVFVLPSLIFLIYSMYHTKYYNDSVFLNKPTQFYFP